MTAIGRSLRVVVASARLQVALLRRDDLLTLVQVPLMTVALVSIVTYSGRSDLTSYAVVAPAVIGVLGMALSTSGETISTDRHLGVFEALLAAPSPLQAVVLGRVLLITAVSLLSVAEGALVATLMGVTLTAPHPGLLVLTLLATAIATAGTATIMSAVFVLARSARIFQNSLSYPLLVLGGAMVPVALLPEWLQPATKVVYLSWATDLLRDCLQPGAVVDAGPRLAMVLLLGAAGFVVGGALMARIVRRVRRTGSVALA